MTKRLLRPKLMKGNGIPVKGSAPSTPTQVQDRLPRHEEHDSTGQIAAERVNRLPRDPPYSQCKEQEQPNNHGGPNKAIFFSNNCKDHVCMGFRKPAELLCAPAWPHSKPTTVGHRHK